MFFIMRALKIIEINDFLKILMVMAIFHYGNCLGIAIFRYGNCLGMAIAQVWQLSRYDNCPGMAIV